MHRRICDVTGGGFDLPDLHVAFGEAWLAVFIEVEGITAHFVGVVQQDLSLRIGFHDPGPGGPGVPVFVKTDLEVCICQGLPAVSLLQKQQVHERGLRGVFHPAGGRK